MSLFQNPFGQDGGSGTPDVGIGGIKCITERHVACVLLLDTSGSMADGDAIGQLNAGIKAFKSQTIQNSTLDEQMKACIDVAMISFGPDVKLLQDFTPVSEMIVPRLHADGGTPMGGALDMALDMVTNQKAKYNELGTPYYRPWIYCITDGAPNDYYESAVQRLKQMESEKRVLGYGVGVRNFDRVVMSQIFAPNRLYELDNLNFTAFFEFLSNSLAAVRNSDELSGGTISVEAPADIHQVKIEY